MTLEEYRGLLSWSQAELACQAGLNNQTVSYAERGEVISSKTALAIFCNALSKALGRQILAKDIDGLNVRCMKNK
jgi:DNA-binding XRE family transcriptional regulator